MTCNGTLVAEGTEADRILFTTLSDATSWRLGQRELYATDNVIRHLDYERWTASRVTCEQHDHRSPDELDGLERPRCVSDQQLQHELHRERHLCGW